MNLRALFRRPKPTPGFPSQHGFRAGNYTVGAEVWPDGRVDMTITYWPPEDPGDVHSVLLVTGHATVAPGETLLSACAAADNRHRVEVKRLPLRPRF